MNPEEFQEKQQTTSTTTRTTTTTTTTAVTVTTTIYKPAAHAPTPQGKLCHFVVEI